MSIIDGTEWENAVGRHLDAVTRSGFAKCRRSGARSERVGGRLREIGKGPADFQVERDGFRLAIEVKAHSANEKRWPLSKIALSQAQDMDTADAALVAMRWAMGMHVPDVVYLLSWANLGPIWWAHKRGEAARGFATLTGSMAATIAQHGFRDAVLVVDDVHGSWTCPPFVVGVMGEVMP